MTVASPTQKLDRYGTNIRLQVKVPRNEYELIEQISADHGVTISAASRMLLREALLARGAG
jgi:hypothetical protein